MLNRMLFRIVIMWMAIAINVLCGSNDQVKNCVPEGGNQVVLAVNPDILITEQVPHDKEYLQKIKPLLFETDKSEEPKQIVYKRAIKRYGGQEVILLTDDEVRISALYFKRPGATVNLIYVPGYFFDLTPTKEWGAPFAALFEEFNILIIDWRGVGASEGVSGFLRKNSFGTNAYPDIQSSIDFMLKENNNPNILIGFCFGAAMALHATVQAEIQGKKTVDALVLDCVFTKFENQFNRAAAAEDRWMYSMILKCGLGRLLLEYQANGSLFSANPIDLIKAIKIPCYFEHYSKDPFAIISEGYEVYQAASCPKMFMESRVGRHVRMHTKVPYQYREAFLTFLQRYNFWQPKNTTLAVAA